MADYVSIEEARAASGLRLVLTQGVPGPWGEAAKAIFHVKGIPYLRVPQDGGGDNAELVAWTGHANAPTAVWNNEAPLAGRNEILLLAERIAPDPPLLPADPFDRATVLGISHEIGGEDGFGWCRRHQLLAPMFAMPDPPEVLAKTRDNLGQRYAYSEAAVVRASVRCVDILNGLSARLHRQRDAGSDYFVGDGLTAADLYWATFCAIAAPLPQDVCSMSPFMRAGYTLTEGPVFDAIDPILLEHRDRIYDRHLELPLDF